MYGGQCFIDKCHTKHTRVACRHHVAALEEDDVLDHCAMECAWDAMNYPYAADRAVLGCRARFNHTTSQNEQLCRVH
jgi:hypothetical protein